MRRLCLKGKKQGGKSLLTGLLKGLILFSQKENRHQSDLVRSEGLVAAEITQPAARRADGTEGWNKGSRMKVSSKKSQLVRAEPGCRTWCSQLVPAIWKVKGKGSSG